MTLFITHVEQATGANFLRIFGQTDPEEALKIEANIREVVVNQKKKFRLDEIKIGLRCLTQYEDGMYYRAKIIRLVGRDIVWVNFIDYGNVGKMHIQELLSLHIQTPQAMYLISTAPQALEYILARISGAWTPENIASIRDELCNDSHKYHVEDKVDRIPIIGVLFKNFDYSQYLIEKREMGTFVSVKNQKESLQAGKLVTSPPQKTAKSIPEKIDKIANLRYLQTSSGAKKNLDTKLTPTNPFLNTTPEQSPSKVSYGRGKLPDMTSPGTTTMEKSFRQIILPPNEFYEVMCTHVEDGYRLFSVQLKQKEPELRKLMVDLSQYPLKELAGPPKIGMGCIVRHDKNNRLYRGVITSIQPYSCLVHFVDFGNTDNISCENMYEIPSHFLRYKMFSVQSTLSYCDELEDSVSLKDYFQQLILRKELKMRVLPNKVSPFVLTCDLYIGNNNVVNELKSIQMFGLRYQPTMRLSEDFQGNVIIRYVDSPCKFYVQLVSNIPEHDILMDKLSMSCQKKGKTLTNLKPGDLCAVCVDNDIDWYRGKVMEVMTAEKKAAIQLVDYGKIIDLPSSSLREIGYQFTQMPPQVYECCIKGFENMHDVTETSANAFEMLVEDAKGERKILKMHIFAYLTEETLLVYLFDETQTPAVNISKSLCKSQMPYKDYVNMFEKKTAITSRKRDSFGRNEVIDTPFEHSGNFSTSSEVDTYQKVPEATVMWDDSMERSPETNGTRTQHREKDKRSPLSNSSTEKPSKRFAESPKGHIPAISANKTNQRFAKNSKTKGSERRDNQGPKQHDRGRDRPNERQTDRQNDRPNNRDPRQNFKGNNGRDQPRANTYSDNNDKDWNVSTAPEIKTVESILQTTLDYKSPQISFNTTINVVFTWWTDPEEFYVQLKMQRVDYDKMMKEIQDFYRNKKPIGETHYEKGWCVMARNSRDMLLSRAKVIDYNQMLNKYKVIFVDKGYRGVATPDAMWPISDTFMGLPAMAIKCSLANGEVLEFERPVVLSQISNYVKDDMGITCKFNEVHDNIYHVNVTVDRGDLLEVLTKDGLVKLPPKVVEEPTVQLEKEPTMLSENVVLNVKLLVGQKICVKMLQVEGLEKFQVNFEHSNITVPAMYYDINCGKILMDKMTEQLKKLEGTFCKVHVVSIGQNDVLRLKILSRVFLEEPPLVCSQVILQDNFKVLVAFVESLNIIHVQKNEFSEILTTQLEEMCKFYDADNNKSNLLFNVAPKGIYAVKSPSDESWYRGEVVSINGDDIKVRYIDYGNEEVVKKENLRFLTPNFAQDSSYATRIFLALEPIASEEDAVQALSDLIVNFLPTLRIVKNYRGEWLGEVSVDGVSVAEELQKKNLAKVVDVEMVMKMIDKREDLMVPPVKDDRISAYVSQIDNPTSFFLQHNADTDAIDSLQQSIQCVAQSLPKVTDPKVGQLCLGLFSMDDQWYRAKILDCAEDITSVQYIDYGNTDTITDGANMRMITDAFDKIKPYARHCALPLVPKDHQDEWGQEAVDIMRNIFQDKTVWYTEVSDTENRTYVHLFTEEGTCAEEIFLKKSMAEPLSMIDANSIGFVSHINGVMEFYMQLEKDVEDLDTVADLLHEIGANGENVANPVEGKMYAALFPDDNLWYRAKLVHSVQQQLEVIFVDFGNTAITNAIKELPKNVAEMPIMSKKCSMELPQGGAKKWSDEADKKFVELAEEGAARFEIHPIAPGDTTKVRLILNGRSVVDILQEGEPMDVTEDANDMSVEDSHVTEQLEESAKVTFVQSPGNFYIQLVANDSTLDKITESLEKPDHTAVSGQEIDTICGATYSDDGFIYRARIEAPEEDDKFRVFFIDYGNSTITSDLWELSQEIQAIEPLAVHCTLGGDVWTEEETKEFREIVDKHIEDTFTVIFVNRQANPAVVRLFVKGEEIVLNRGSPDVERRNISMQIVEEMVDNSTIAVDIVDSSVENIMIAKEICDRSLNEISSCTDGTLEPHVSLTDNSDIAEIDGNTLSQSSPNKSHASNEHYSNGVQAN